MFVPVPGNPSRFVLCPVNPTDQPIEYQCATNYYFNSFVQGCTWKCPAAGRYPNIGDPTNQSFYECVLETIRIIVAYLRICPNGSYFNMNIGSGPFTGICTFFSGARSFEGVKEDKLYRRLN